jgi:hypothetical protein
MSDDRIESLVSATWYGLTEDLGDEVEVEEFPSMGELEVVFKDGKKFRIEITEIT